MFVVHCLVLGVCCMVFLVYWRLCVGRCLFGVCCGLSVVRFFFVEMRCLMCVVRWLLRVVC